MKAWEYFAVLLMAVVCLGVSVALILTTQSNQELQQTLQARQTQIANGVLGPQAQQIASSILQDMGRSAVTNEPMRQLLAKHGYNVGGAATPAAPGNGRTSAPESEDKP